MLYSSVFALFVAASGVGMVASAPTSLQGANARRLAQGLGPLPPARRTPTTIAGLLVRQQPSGVPQTCPSDNLLCCRSALSHDSPSLEEVLEGAGAPYPPPPGLVGALCTPQKEMPVPCRDLVLCCADNSYGGSVALGCQEQV